MKGKSALIWLGLAGAAGAVLFQTSYEVQGREEELASLNRKIVLEQEAIQILKAEWSYLNDMARLETMARTHLSLRPTEARQFLASAEIIPMRPAPAPVPEALPPMAGLGQQPQSQTAALKAAPAAAPAKAPARPTPAPAVIEPASVKVAPKAQPAVVKPQQQPQPQTLPAPKNIVPANAKPPAPTKTDSLGVMIARLGGNR